MVRLKKLTHVYDMKVFTDNGEYFGDIEEAILTMTKVFCWRIRASRNSTLSKVLGGAKGVIVPHKLVRAVGDVMIISKTAMPEYGEVSEETAMEEGVAE